MATHPHFLWSDLFRRSDSDKNSLTDTLKENILFSTLTRSELNYLTRMVYERVYQPDEIVFQQNDRSFGLFIISKGRVAIKTLSQDSETLVTLLGKGSFFGELSLVDPDISRTANAVAVERTTLISFFKPDLMEIMNRKPDMGVKILHQLTIVLGRRLIETTERISLLTAARGYGLVHGESF